MASSEKTSAKGAVLILCYIKILVFAVRKNGVDVIFRV